MNIQEAKNKESQLYSSRQVSLMKMDTPDIISSTENHIDQIDRFTVDHLSKWFNDLPSLPNRIARGAFGEEKSQEYRNIINLDKEVVMFDIVRKAGLTGHKARSFIRAGPSGNTVWHMGEVRAAIVTCGGLCPGLNNVIAELVNTLYFNYGVDTIYGIQNGYRGFYQPSLRPWKKLHPKDISHIAMQGGTYLGSSRGGFDLKKIVDSIELHGVNQVFIVGGDGTHRGAIAIADEVIKRNLKVIVAGVPKTIDNDIGVIDRSFGFNTAVEEARKAIQSAIVEAQCTPHGVGVVKLMGRHAGYISAHATLASRDVDLCLVPEVSVDLEGKCGVLNHIENCLKLRGHSVVVVAEGAGSTILKDVETGTDESGNKIIPDIGEYLTKRIKHFLNKRGINPSIKYHDPSYMIRSVPANAADAVYCITLAQNAVHAAMAGYTKFTSAIVNNRSILLPMEVVNITSPAYLNPNGRTWERVVSVTHQPHRSQDPKEDAADNCKNDTTQLAAKL